MTSSTRNNRLNLLARRAGYNLALRHFRLTQEFAGDVEDGYNLADILNAAFQRERVEEYQIRPIVNILLTEKFGYACGSQNLRNSVENVDRLVSTVAAWTKFQVVLVYTDANGGVHLLNPDSPEPWEAALPLAKDEHLICYVGSQEKVKDGVLAGAVKDVMALLNGGKPRRRPSYSTSNPYKKFVKPGKNEDSRQASAEAPRDREEEADPAPSAVPSVGGSKKLTAKIAVNVTNELFHNGNVEAWKKIIESYRHSYPNLDVLIWYEGERINDINALFKWGKVKHGVPIMFSVAGDDPKDLSKLRKYLFEGASSRFEAFLHGAYGTILQLF